MLAHLGLPTRTLTSRNSKAYGSLEIIHSGGHGRVVLCWQAHRRSFPQTVPVCASPVAYEDDSPKFFIVFTTPPSSKFVFSAAYLIVTLQHHVKGISDITRPKQKLFIFFFFNFFTNLFTSWQSQSWENGASEQNLQPFLFSLHLTLMTYLPCHLLVPPNIFHLSEFPLEQRHPGGVHVSASQ